MNGNRFEEMVITGLNELRRDISSLRQEISEVKTDLHKEISGVKTDVAWVKGKLEGRSDTRHVVLTGISIFVAICAVVVAFLK